MIINLLFYKRRIFTKAPYMHIVYFLLCIMMIGPPACSQKSDKPILLMNARVHTGNGEVIENAALAFENEKISLLADATLIRLDMSAFEVVDAFGAEVYPAALIDQLPDTASENDSLYYATLNQGAVLSASRVSAASPLQELEEGGEASFIVVDEALTKSTAQILYLVVKGKLKRENSVSLRRLGTEP